MDENQYNGMRGHSSFRVSFFFATFLLFDSQKDKDPRKIPNYLLTSWTGVRMLIYSTFTKGHLQYIRLLSVCLSNRAITFLNIAIGI